MFYSGIGSRTAPSDILDLMYNLGVKLAFNGYILRSGGAIGSDTYFERGCDSVNGQKVIYLAEHATDESISYSSNFHNDWKSTTAYVKRLHGRNSLIVLGDDLKTPSRFVVCWTKNGKDVGGTGLAIRIAKYNKIDVINLYDSYWRDRVERYCSGICNIDNSIY